MKQFICIVSLLVFLTSCDNTSKPSKPEKLISKDKMENILYDLYIINAAKGVNRKLLEDNGVVPESYLLSKYKIDSLQFVQSNAYYAFDSDLYKDMVEKVRARLENEKKTFEDLEKKESKEAKQRRDSINKINKNRKDSIRESLKPEVKR